MLKRSVNYNFDYIPDIHHKFEGSLLKTSLKGKRVLDIGCWTGQFLSLIEKDAKSYGIDPDKSAIKFANAHRRGDFVVGTALKLPYKKNYFDVVTMWDVIEHIPPNTEVRALREATRVLKKGGLFALSTVTTHPVSILLDPAYFLLGHRHYSKNRLHSLIKKAGFEIEKTIYSGGLWALIRENVNLFTKHVFKKNVNVQLFERLVRSEYQGEGFYQIHIFALKK